MVVRTTATFGWYVGVVTINSCVAAVEASGVDEVDGVVSGAVEELPFVVGVLVLHLQLFLHQLVALPQRRVLDPFNLPDTEQSTLFSPDSQGDTTD